jgi:cation diffusion facilitator family transporter
VGTTILLAVLKGFAGMVGGSHALIADGLHSAADVIISLAILASLRIGEKEPDRNHSYGYGKVEFIAGSIVTVVLMIALVFLFKDAVEEMNLTICIRPRVIALFAALVSIAVSALLFRLNSCAGRELKSPTHAANAVHNRYDMYISAVVLAGILGAMAGIKLSDPLAVIIVGVVMIKTFIEILTRGYAGLMDTSFPLDVKQEILDTVTEVNGVDKVLSIKARCLGQKFWIDLCVEVNASLTVSESYTISETIREAILFRVENIEDVQIETKSAVQAT